MNKIKYQNRPESEVHYEDRPGSYGILIDDNKLIAVIRLDTNYFLPGGGIDDGESPEICLSREVREELGFKVLEYLPIGEAIEHIYAPRMRKHYKIHGYYFRITKYIPIHAPIDKDHTVCWVEPSDALLHLQRPGQTFMLRNEINKLDESLE